MSKEHLARLDASAGGAFWTRLQSPLAAAGAAVPPPAVGAAVTFASPSVGGVAGLASVGLEGGADVAGEYFLPGGVPGSLTAFVMTPELMTSLCCGAITGGVKFCTLGSTSCSFSSHTKKVPVLATHIYISTGRNSALTNHHALVAALSPLELQALLQERHTEKGWAQLLQVLGQIPPEDKQGCDMVGVDDAIAVEQSVLAFVTPGRKRKERYGEAIVPSLETGDPGEKGPHPLTAYPFSSDNLVIIPTQDSQEVSDEERLANMMEQWGLVVNTLNQSTSVVKRLQNTVAGDLDALDARIVGVRADLGNVPSNSAFGDCISAWDGLLLLQNEVESIATENTCMKEALQGWEQAEGKLRKSVLDFQQVLRT
jgi:hypothetical protein